MKADLWKAWLAFAVALAITAAVTAIRYHAFRVRTPDAPTWTFFF